MNRNKTIGVLGGMGPEASSTLYRKIIKYTQYQYQATQDNEYPPVLLNSITLEGFDETGITDEALVRSQLIDGVRSLERGGADFVIVACNTVHYFYDDMQDAVEIPVLNIIDESRDAVRRFGFRAVGLFSSESTGRLGLYQKSFSDADLEVITADEAQQGKLNRVIMNVMGGRQSLNDVFSLKEVQREMVSRGAEGIVLGCTEIPLAFNQSHTDVKLFDTIEIIVRRAVDDSLGSSPRDGEPSR